MAKRSKKGKDIPTAPTDTASLSHNPFASLAGLQGSAPSAEPATAKELVELPRRAPAVKAAAPAKSTPKPPAPGMAPKTLPPSPRFPGKLVVRRENKGRAGKTVTRISGLPKAELASLSTEMKKALGCGATIEADDLILLGSLVDRASAWLQKAGAGKLVKGN